MQRLAVATMLPILALAFVIEAQAQTTRYVGTFGFDLDNNCSSQAQPCGTIAHAVGESDNGDTIAIFTGTYTQETIVLSNRQLKFLGQGAGPNGTIIQRQAGGPNEPLGRVLWLTNGSEIEVENIWIRHGNINSTGGGIRQMGESSLTLLDARVSDNVGSSGGGINMSNNSSLILDNTVVRDNLATTRGGGVDLVGSSSVIVRNQSQIIDNTAEGPGGGFFVGGTLTLNTGTVVADNRAEGNFSTGGGISIGSASFVGGGTVVLLGAEVRDNEAGGDGGGVFARDGSLTVSSTSRIEGNHSGRLGGGIRLRESSLTMLDSSVVGNHAGIRGGGVLLAGPGNSATIRYSTIMNNQTPGDGGGIRAESSGEAPGTVLEVTNSTISGNEAEQASGLDFDVNEGDLVLRNVTIADNRSAGSQGALRFSASSSVSMSLGNVLLADQRGTTRNCQNSAPSSDGGNLSTDNSCGLGTSDIENGDADLLPLFDNGGNTLTHALRPESDAVGSADQSICAGPGVFSLDQRSFPRPLGEPCDVGAYELGELALQIASATLSDGELDQPYSLMLEAAGGQPPYLWSDQGTLPAGLSVDADNGIITGNPTQFGMFQVTIVVSDDDNDSVEKDFALRILGPDPIFFDRFE